MSDQERRREPNRLGDETSPYLLQHAYNPVDWYPWGDEALARSKELDRPIFLSVGYSACHWCHVMERECFEDPEIARLMNELFINVKVDREERPDIDGIYMNAVQLLTRSGGWPMSVFLTPDLRPFYAGTYFPPSPRGGMPGFPQILTEIARYWRDEGERIEESAASVTARLREMETATAAGDVPGVETLENAVRQAERNFDSEWGGFGGAPKFPRALELSVLLRWHARTGHENALRMVETTLERMALGGMYDQIGGGFHRYSVDRRWLVPHFEKMLYDNALLARTYLEAYQITGSALYERVAKEVLDYVVRELELPGGGFSAATDADSEGEEGKFFVWTPAQVAEIVGESAARVVCTHLGITEAGNFEGGTSIPHHATSLEETALALRMDAGEAARVFEEARAALYRARSERVPPLRDEKLIVSWNALMISALARGYQVFGDSCYLESALGSARLIFEKLGEGGRLLRTWKDGRARHSGCLDDHAYMLEACIDLYESTFDLQWLERAREIADGLQERFLDADAGGFFFTASDHEKLICRRRDFLDSATPAGNAVAALGLLRFERLSGETRWRGLAEGALRAARRWVEEVPMATGATLVAVDFHAHPTVEVAVLASESQGAGALLAEVYRRFVPSRVVAGSARVGADAASGEPELLAGKQAEGGSPTAFVCRDYACRAPTTNPRELGEQLELASGRD